MTTRSRTKKETSSEEPTWGAPVGTLVQLHDGSFAIVVAEQHIARLGPVERHELPLAWNGSTESTEPTPSPEPTPPTE